MDKQKTRGILKYYFEKDKKIKKAGALTPIIRDEKTAVKVAEAILFKIYGEEQIKNERPYTIGFADGYWVMYGYLPKGTLGGVFEIIINSNNGGVIDIRHGK
jgi:hypothetical protein